MCSFSLTSPFLSFSFPPPPLRPLTVFLSLPDSLTFSHILSLSLSRSLFLLLPPSISLPHSLSLARALFVSHSLSFSRSLCRCISLSLPSSIPASLSPFLPPSLSFSLPLPLSLCLQCGCTYTTQIHISNMLSGSYTNSSYMHDLVSTHPTLWISFCRHRRDALDIPHMK